MSEITNTATIRVVADASGVEAGLRPAVEAARRTEQAVAQVGNGAAASARNVEAAQRNIIGSIQRTTVAMESGGRQTAAYYETLARQRGIDPGVLAPYIAQLRAVEQAQARTATSAGASAGQIANAMRMVPAQLTDIAVGLQGGQSPMTILFQQGGQLRDMFGSIPATLRGVGSSLLGLVNPFTVVAAAGAALLYVYEKGSEEAAAYSHAIITSGNAAGTSKSQLADYAREVGKTVGTQGDAAAALAALTETGKVGAENLKQFAATTVGAQNVLSHSVADTVAQFGELGKSPLSALEKINDRYHFITASTYAQVKALQDQGKASEAAEVAQRAYADGIDKQRQKVLDSLTDWERGWIRIKNATSGAVDAALNIGRGPTDSQKLAALMNVRDTLEANQARASEMRDTKAAAAYQKLLDQNKDEINVLRKKEDATKATSKAEADAAQVTEARNKWLVEGDKYLNRSVQLERDVAKARNEGAAAHLSTADIEKRVGDIRKSYSDLFNAGIDSNIAALKRREQVADLLAQRELARIATQRSIGNISEEQAINDSAKTELAKIDGAIQAKQAELALIKKKFNSVKDQSDKEGEIDGLREQRTNREEKQQNDILELQERRRQSSEELYKTGIVGATAERNSILDQLKAQLESNQEIGLSTRQVTELRAARLEHAAALKDEAAATQDAIPGGAELAKIYRDQAQGMRDRAGSMVRGAAKQEIYEKPLQDLNAMVDIMSALDQAAQSAAQGMAKSFGSVGEAIGGMTTALTGYERTQAAIAAQLAGSIKDAHGDPEKIARANMMATEASAQAQIRSYGDMAGAAKGFFDQNSKGYKVLGTVEKAYRAAEMVMALESMTKKIFFKETEVAANTALNATKLTGEAATSAASTGLAATEASAWGVTAVVKAIASLPFPYSLAAGAATLAAVVAVGAKMVGSLGGGSVSLSEQRQKEQGAGSVLGDSDAKSESIKNALDLVEKNTYQGLAISGSMLATLRSIDNNIGSFASQLVRSTDVTGKYAATTSSFGGGFLGSVMSSIFGGKTSVQDTGFSLSATSLAQALAGGVNGMQYTDMHKSGGWFSSGKDWTDSKSLGADANAQFTAIIKSLAGSVKTAGELLGISGDDFTAKLNSFVIDIGHVSLKDLKGDDLQKALESVFSKLGDDMASFAVGGLSQFQQVGEGYLETLARVASEYQSIDVVFQSFGKTFGEVGLASIGARDRLVQLAGGLDKFTSQGEYFLTNFFSDKEQANALKARVQPVLDQYGLQASGEGAMRALRDFVVCLDTTTEAGAQAYTTLMQYAPAVKQIADAEKAALDERKGLQDQLDELTMSSAQLLTKQRDALDESNRALFDQVQGIKAQATALQATKDAAAAALGDVDNAFSVLQRVTKTTTDALTARITAEKSLSDAVKSTLASMKAQGSEMSSRAAAQAQVQAALAIVKAGGPLPDAAAMQKSLSVLSQDASSMFATLPEYLRDFYSTQNDIAALGDLADSSLSVDQKQLDSLNAMLAADQQQIDLLKGISSALTIQQAQDGFQQALAGAQANPYSGSVAGITSAYASILGRAPDAAGLEYWKTQAAGGMSIDQIMSFMKDSSEYKHLNGIPGFASGGMFSGGLRLVGENGPELEATGPSRIWSSNQTAALLSRAGSGDSSAVVAELKAVREELKALREANSAENRAIAKGTQETAGHLDAAVNGDTPLATKVLA